MHRCNITALQAVATVTMLLAVAALTAGKPAPPERKLKAPNILFRTQLGANGEIVLMPVLPMGLVTDRVPAQGVGAGEMLRCSIARDNQGVTITCGKARFIVTGLAMSK